MRVLVVGSGGREHVLCWKLAQSGSVTKLYCAPGNAGIARLATCVPVRAADVDGIVAWAKREKIDFVVVAPDDPLALGCVDALEAAGVPAFGPRRAAAEIESSKIYAKTLMQKYNIPTARWCAFDQPDRAIDYIRAQGAPIVVKADGLALGKGVVVARTEDEAVRAVRDMMENKRFREAGARVVVEECMTGPEVTVLAFTDGKTVVPMPSSRDHKPVFDGNQGPNTGGMGAVSPAPGYTPALAALCEETIFTPTVRALAAEGRPFQGVLYFGLMLTEQGPRVVEYNARFGDPEAQAVLMLLESDLLDILLAVRGGTLASADIRWRPEAACCVVLASGGYPGAYPTGLPITGLPDDTPERVVFHAGTVRQGTDCITAGGRVLGVTARAPSPEEARRLAYETADAIRFEGLHMRRDIGL
ncbi:MAG: phosphoribosylamine--glycine ligase [Oscillospiraceae bacterium]|nr:phosphoribosylamine--glycine ligase [Oscillospiraceae bacterium]